MRPPFSSYRGGLRIGADFFLRRAALRETTNPPRGLVDRLSAYSNPGLDVKRVHPAIVQFFEDTESLELLIRSEWRFPFSLFWFFVRPLMAWLGQFVLPRREARVLTEVSAMDTERDGRADARAVIRRYAESGGVMQVIAYASWQHAGTGYMSAAFPLPLGQIAGILRLDPLEPDAEGPLAVVLSSERRGDQAGVWAVLGPVAFRAPLAERLALWGADMPSALRASHATHFPGVTLVGLHEQRLFGLVFAVHHYWFRPCSRAPLPKS